MAIGNNMLAIIGNDENVYISDLSNFTSQGGFQNNTLEIKKWDFFDNEKQKALTSRKIYGGFASFLIYEKEIQKNFEDWTNSDCVEFFEKKNFDDYVNIVKYQGITGKDLSQISKNEMRDRLGLLREDLQMKLWTEIIKAKEQKAALGKIYAWGKNDQGQLGINNCNQISQPQVVQLPEDLDADDDIQDIKIGWKNTVLFTQKKRIFISVNSDKKKEKLTCRFIEVGDKFNLLSDKKKFEILQISCSKDCLSVMANHLLIQQQQEKNVHKKSIDEVKLTPANQVINRIKWDSSFDKTEFSVVYQDRFLKDMEIEFVKFEGGEIKSHRITHFKRNGKVVWDREKKWEDL